MHYLTNSRRFGCCLLALCIAFTLSDCAARPAASEYPRTVTHAIAPDVNTPLLAAFSHELSAHPPSQSGFRLLTTGLDAFATRIALIRSASKTLDIQYYIVESDITGKTLLEEVLRAADRGVRVRILIDNMNLENPDGLMAVLDAHKNIEIRGFNPVTTKSQGILSRAAMWLLETERYTRRMHNKVILADSMAAATGGRNLGDEYFDADSDFAFNDIDILCVGPIALRMAVSFDQYWNHDESYPMEALDVKAPSADKIHETRGELAAHWEEVAASATGKALLQPSLLEQAKKGKAALVWAAGELTVDRPDKVQKEEGEATSPPINRLSQLLENAKKEFIAVTPYFVPGKGGTETLEGLVKRGVRVRVLTNSLASTDVPVVHTGYSKYREALLAKGVELHEFKPIEGLATRQNMPGSRPRSSLHSKVYVVDRKHLVVGSFNLDPRSAELNTEMAVVVHSEALATQVAHEFEATTAPRYSYRVLYTSDEKELEGLSPDAKRPHLVWVTEEKGEIKRLYEEPGASFWRGLQTVIFSVLPFEDQL